MRSVALLALLAVGAFAGDFAVQPYPANGPSGDAKFGIDPAGSDASTWFTDLTSTLSWTYAVPNADQGKNYYFRTTIYNCSSDFDQAFTTTIVGDDGTGTKIPPHSGAFTVTSSVSTAYVPGEPAVAIIIGAGGDSTANAGQKVWTYTVTLTQPRSGQVCKGFVDLISYGGVVSSSKIGADGNPGGTIDAWVPCCDALDTVFAIAAKDQPHKYLEAAVQTQQGEFNYVKLHNPTLFSIDDITHFPSSGKGIVTVRTCLSNQSCEVKAQNYFVHIVNNANSAMDEDAHATFTLTTKAGVASASAAIAMLVAALFALFH
jgi:hypothetical protein